MLTQVWFFNFEQCTRLRLIDCTNHYGVKTGTSNSTEFDVSFATRLEVLRLGGTGVQSVELAEGAPLTELVLPSTLSVLKLRYLPALTTAGLTIEGYAGITTPEEALELLSTYFSLYAPYEGQKHMSLRQSSYDIWLNFMNDNANGRDVRINYYFKGPVIGLLMDIDIRRKTDHAGSLDDVMRLLYRRFYKERQCGFTEEDFWQACAEVAGQPLDDIRRLVDTTAEIDYDSYLSDAGLCADTTEWSIQRVPEPTPAQEDFLRKMELYQ